MASVVLYLHSTSNHNQSSRGNRGRCVVLYLHSTSNHNRALWSGLYHRVVLYLHSTSNHNLWPIYYWNARVVLYLHSTSNHNPLVLEKFNLMLYYIFILHQTTTWRITKLLDFSCIISSFYIKPQLLSRFFNLTFSCIISSFYIKPQPPKNACKT